MYAVWSLCLAHIRKKKLQNGLVSLLILLSTLLLATSITVISNTEDLFTESHDQTNGSHQILTLGTQWHAPSLVQQWWSQQEGVATSRLIPFRNLAGVTVHGKEITNLYTFMMNTPEQPFGVDELIFAQGQEAAQPEPGTIWIPTSMAVAHDISLGDSVGFKTGQHDFELQVAAIVVDIPYGGPFTTNARIWMNQQDFREQLHTMQGEERFMLGLRFDNYSLSPSYWASFESFLGQPYLETKTEFEELSSFYLIISKVIGFIMIFLGVVMMLVALFTIGFTISDAILSNYRTIGVIKSVGLSSAKIIATYVTQYALLALVAIVPGLVISQYLSKILVESALSFLKTDQLPMNIVGLQTSVVVGLFVLAVVLLCAFSSANKARSVQPVQAIRYGMSEADYSKLTNRLSTSRFFGGRILGFGMWPVFFVIGLRNLFKNMKGSILMLLLTTVTSAVLVFGFILLNSIHQIGQTSPLWGYDSSDIAVTIYNKAAFDRNSFEAAALADPRIKNIGWVSHLTGVLPANKKQNTGGSEAQSLNIAFMALEGSYDELGYATLEGYNPRNKNEISIGMNVAKQLHKDIGDTVDVFIEGQKHTFMVTGIYQAIANMSYSARIKIDAVQDQQTDNSHIDVAFINVFDVHEAERFVSEMNGTFGDSIQAATLETLLNSVYKEASAVLALPFSMMGLLFIFVTLMIIYSICRINIRKESKTYGIYKSLGLTSWKIRASLTLGISILSSIGALLGVVAGVYVLPRLLENILVTYGIVELPLVLSHWGILLVSLMSIGACCLGSWLSSKIIRQTSPRILVVE